MTFRDLFLHPGISHLSTCTVKRCSIHMSQGVLLACWHGMVGVLFFAWVCPHQRRFSHPGPVPLHSSHDDNQKCLCKFLNLLWRRTISLFLLRNCGCRRTLVKSPLRRGTSDLGLDKLLLEHSSFPYVTGASHSSQPNVLISPSSCMF